MPDPLPVIVLGRPAVPAGGVGRGIRASALIGMRALLCHALDEEVTGFVFAARSVDLDVWAAVFRQFAFDDLDHQHPGVDAPYRDIPL